MATSSALCNRSKIKDKTGTSDSTSEMQEKWDMARWTKTVFGAMVTGTNDTKLVGESSVFQWGQNI